MKKLILRNSFHGTECTILADEGDSSYAAYQDILCRAHGAQDYAERRRNQAKLNRIRRELCGMADCKCGIIR